MTRTTVKARMTLDDVLEDMREHGMKIGKRALSDGLKSGLFPFARILNVGAAGRTTFLIFRKDYEAWAREFIYFD